jgi:Ca2+-binding RTX toxin-like protein
VATGTTVTLGDAGDEFDDQTVDINLADATGTSDALTVNLVDTDDQSSTATIDADGIETVTLALANSNEKHTVAMENNLTASTVVVTGTDVDADLTLSSIEAGITTVNASGLAGELTIADTARGSDAMTITGGTGADTIEMENAADVLTGGAGATISDEVQVTFSGTGGAIVVDLSSTTDQVTLFNGVANSVAQTGFEDIDVSGYTQTGSVGADITGSTGANVIVGTGYADTIRGGEGADTITGGAGADVISLTETTATVDTLVFSAVATNGIDTVTGFATASDKLDVSGTGTLVGTIAVDTAASGAAIALSAAKGLVVTDDCDATFSDIITILNAALDTSGTVTGDTVLVVDNGTDSRVYLYEDDTNAAAVAIGELTHLMTLSSTILAEGDLTVA